MKIGEPSASVVTHVRRIAMGDINHRGENNNKHERKAVISGCLKAASHKIGNDSICGVL